MVKPEFPFVVPRAPVLVRATRSPIHGDPLRTPHTFEELLLLLEREPEFTDSLFDANPELVARLFSGNGQKTSRLLITATSYLLRARTRATPSGLFAGVVLSGPDDRGLARWGTHHLTFTVPHSGGSAQVGETAGFASDISNLAVLMTHPMIRKRGSRYFLRRSRLDDPGVENLLTTMVSINATEATEFILSAARSGVTVDDLIVDLTSLWPETDPQLMDNALREMASQGFLIVSTPDLVEPPSDVPVAGRRLWNTVLRLDADLPLPAELRREVARAVALLWRCSAQTSRESAMARYRDAFEERWGLHRLVPLIEVIDPLAGLGYPGKGSPPQAPEDPRHTAAKAAMVHEATVHGHREIVLTEAHLEDLAVTTQPSPTPPRSGEIWLTVVADAWHDLESGSYQLAADPYQISYTAGSTYGRFVPFMAEGNLAGVVASEGAGAVVAEICTDPLLPRHEPLVPVTGLVGHRIAMGGRTRQADGVEIPLNDLVVGVTRDRMFLISKRSGLEVVPVLFSRINPELLPPLAGMLKEIGRGPGQVIWPWTWGASAFAPYRPRITVGKVILHPATWRLPAAVLRSVGEPSSFTESLSHWRSEAVPPVPSRVVMAVRDRRLPVDLDHPVHREILRRNVARGLVDEVHEFPGGEENSLGVRIPGSSGRHAVELVVPFHSRKAPARASADGLSIRSSRHGMHLPGGSWISIILPAPAECQHQILATLERVLAVLGEDVDRLFFVRYRDVRHGEHLRIRLRSVHPSTGATLTGISGWAADLHATGLAGPMIIGPYDPEAERYGGLEAIQYAERVFTADSVAAVSLLATAPPEDTLLSVTASTILLVNAHLGVDRVRWDLPRPQAAQATHDLAKRLFVSGPPSIDEPTLVEALNAYSTTLRGLGVQARRVAAGGVAHMAANRRLGADRAAEQTALLLARKWHTAQRSAHPG